MDKFFRLVAFALISTIACDRDSRRGGAADEKSARAVATKATEPQVVLPPFQEPTDANLQVESLQMNGLKMRSIDCQVKGGAAAILFGGMGLGGMLAGRKDALEACVTNPVAVRIRWKLGSANYNDFAVEGMGGRAAVCLVDVLKNQAAPFAGVCAATLLLRNPPEADAENATSAWAAAKNDGNAGNSARPRSVKFVTELLPGSAQIRGKYSRELLLRNARRHSGQLRQCYEAGLRRQPGLFGRVVIRFIIDDSGAVADSKIESSTLNNAAVEDCLVKETQGWEFPKPRNGRVDVSYPFFLQEPSL